VIFDPDFKVTTFSTLNISETTRDRTSYYRTSIGSHVTMRSIAWWHFQWPWRNPKQFSKSRHFWSRISQKRCILGTVFLQHTNRKPYAIYRMVPLSMTSSDLLTRISRSRHFLKSNIWQRQSYKRKVYLTYGMVLCLLTLTGL